MRCSADMLEDIKVPWVILGHSERRSLLKESEEVKRHALLGHASYFNCTQLGLILLGAHVVNPLSCHVNLDVSKHQLAMLGLRVLLLPPVEVSASTAPV